MEKKFFRHRLTVYFDTTRDVTDEEMTQVEEDLKEFFDAEARGIPIDGRPAMVHNWETDWSIVEVKDVKQDDEST